MEYPEMFKVIQKLEFDKKTTICKEGETEVYVIRPSKLPKSLKNKYNPEKNFQIWLKEGQREFRPNHLRILIDLNLRIRCRPDLKRELLLLFDEIFYGADPQEKIKRLSREDFQYHLNSLNIIAQLSQLFIIEQAFNYEKESKFEPKTLFIQGWIREFIDNPKELDNMVMSVCNFQPPQTQYTDKENKKNKKFVEKRESLWYMNQ